MNPTLEELQVPIGQDQVSGEVNVFNSRVPSQ